jgi:hypothetical protein
MDALLEAARSRLLDTGDEHVFFLLDVSNKLGQEYVHMFDDFLRMFTIQFTLQLMLYLSDPYDNAFVSGDFVLLVFYIFLGVALYWLVFRNLIGFH